MNAIIPGHKPADYIVGHARAVLPDRIVEDARIVVRDHHIVEITSGARGVKIDFDASGLTVTPGFIDTHSDALEKERTPRAGVEIPVDFALQTLEARVAGVGVTTMYHGTGFRNQSVRGVERSVDRALEETTVIDTMPQGRVDHRVLHRLDLLSDEGADALARRFDDMPARAYPTLVSFEDHTPGQGQYSDAEGLRRYLIDNEGVSEEEADARMEKLIDGAEAGAATKLKNEQWLADLAARGLIRSLGHDMDTADVVDRNIDLGVEVAEFPTTIEAAHQAFKRGLVIAGGGPNALRGRSHNNNISAARLAEDGLLDALTSDYFPPALLGGAMVLLRQGLVDLPGAISLITAGPARLAGLSDRGELAEGRLADLAFIDFDNTTWPRVITTHKAWK